MGSEIFEFSIHCDPIYYRWNLSFTLPPLIPAGPVMGVVAGFHTDLARWQVAANDLGFDKYCFAMLVNTMQSKYILGEIDADGDNIHGLPLSNE